MIPYKLPNADAGEITITSTATNLMDLVATAGSAAHGLPSTVNMVRITIKTFNARCLNNNTPTATKGKPLYAGGVYDMEDPFNIKLIRVDGSDCTATVEFFEKSHRE